MCVYCIYNVYLFQILWECVEGDVRVRVWRVM